METAIQTLIIGLALIVAAIGAFILLREFNCWYLKINKRLAYEKAIFLILYRMAEKNEILSRKDLQDMFLMSNDDDLKAFILKEKNGAK